MKLHLIRHAKTEQLSPTGKDFDRQLMERGKMQSKNLNRYLQNQNLKNAQIFCSNAARTTETLSYLTNNFSYDNCFFNQDLYLCSYTKYLELIWKMDHGEDLVFIGHNFGISDLANYFLDASKELRTAEYICISFPFENWSETSRATGSVDLQYRPSV